MMNCQTLKFRFIAISLFLLVVGTAFRFGLAVPFTRHQVHDLVASQQMELASYVARDIGQRIATCRNLVGRLASSLPLVDLKRKDQFDDWLGEQRKTSPQFAERVLLLNLDGSVIYDSAPWHKAIETESLAGEPWFREALTAQTPVLAKPRLEAGGSPVMLIASPVGDAKHAATAVLVGIFPLGSSGLLQGRPNNPIGESGNLLPISSGDDLLVGVSDPANRLSATPSVGKSPLHDQATKDFRGTEITTNKEGIEELSSVAGVPETDWFVVARMPVSEAFQPVRGLIAVALKGTLMALAAIFLLVFIVVPKLLQPLTTAAQSMRAIADGKQELLPLPVHRNDEVGMLVQGFNYLVERLRTKEAALKASETRLSFLAHHDSLTGLSNRNMLELRLQEALQKSQRDHTPFALLFCDLDGFKKINDAYGHKTGDTVLIKLAARFKQGRKLSDTVTRLGGDEFVILLTQLDDARQEAEHVARYYIDAIQKPCEVDGNLFTLSVSIGIVLYDNPETSSSQLLSQADIAMYEAKRQGKNQFLFFNTSNHDTIIS